MQEFDPHVLDEKPVPPPQDFSKRAHVKSLEEYRKMHALALEDPDTFWGEQAKMLDWFEPPKRTLEWNLPHAKWFVGGKLNVSYNCLDRHLEENGNKPALLWEAEDGAKLELTYAELHQRVCRMANALESIGVKAGDAVTIYLPMIPELTIAMLACARIGAVHSVIFGGFSAQALIDRIGDSKSKLLITADGGYRRGKVVPLKETADLALPGCPTIEKTIVVRRTGEKVGWQQGRDLWWHELEQAAQERLPGDRVRFRAAAVHSLYQRHNRKAERACCTPRPGICCRPCGPRDLFSIYKKMTSTGVPRTSVGSPDTAMWSTGRWPMPQQ